MALGIGDFIAPGLSFLGNLGNSIIGASSNAYLNRVNRKWQEGMAALQYQRQRQLTQDTPVLQKQGLIEAGMSPSALGGYSGSASSVSTVPSSPPV